MTNSATCLPNDAFEQRPTNLGAFVRWLRDRRGLRFTNYNELWHWSTTDLEGFWTATQEFLDIPFSCPAERVLTADRVDHATWFSGAMTNYVNSVPGVSQGDRPALISISEGDLLTSLSHDEVRLHAANLAATLRAHGVGLGDRVAGYLPNIAETAIAFYATAAIGAIWSSVGLDYESEAAVARLGQLNPRALITATGYRFRGSHIDRRRAVEQVHQELGRPPTILVDTLGSGSMEDTIDWTSAVAGTETLEPVQVPFDHPLWVLFSSGTTGIPKGIVHSHGGVQLECHKGLKFHWDLNQDSRLLWATSPSWVVWNILVTAPLLGATAVLFDGDPTYPGPTTLWRVLAEHRVSHFGTSPGFLTATQRSGLDPAAQWDLSALKQVNPTGSPLARSTARWTEIALGPGVELGSISGGTDVVGPFVGGTPGERAEPGEIPTRCLGIAVEAWDENGNSVIDDVGELVITRPMPSMPLKFWNDPDGSRLHAAYFADYPGYWRHGDWITITSRGTVVVHGRSDATLNRNGVRLGSADIYAIVGAIPEIEESLVVGVELPEGAYWLPLFVQLARGHELDDELRSRIVAAIREKASPRHVPDEILAVPSIPHTRTGKRLEVPVKRILQGARVDDVVSRSAVDDPTALDHFATLQPRDAIAPALRHD